MARPLELLAAFQAYLRSLDDATVKDFLSWIEWDMRERALAPSMLSCLGSLDRAVEIAPAAEQPLARLLARSRHVLHWGQTYTAADLGPRFIDGYGWMELFGSRGHFANQRVAAGFLILGPDIVYPDHRHVAEELYVPLTAGTAWRKDGGVFAPRGAGEIIHHSSNVDHAMRTGSEPLLALYLWRGGPLAQKSTIIGSG